MSRLAKSDAVKVLPKEPKGLASGEPAKAKPLHLFWNNEVHTVIPNEKGMYNLNQLHRVSGAPRSKAPNDWVRNSQATDLIAKYSKPEFSGLVVKRGGYTPGTWAIEEIVYAYASWLSAEFHKAVLDAFTAAVSGDMVKVREIVRTAVRQEGVPIRKEFASTFMSTDPRAEAIEFATDQINLAVTGKTAEGIKALTVLKMV